jgi:hypothetical protein
MRAYRLLDYKTSLNSKLVWVVVEDHGKCGCGACDMASQVAWFEDKLDAQMFLLAKAETAVRQ